MAEQDMTLNRSFPFEERANYEVCVPSVVNKDNKKDVENPQTGTKTTIQANLHRVAVGFAFLPSCSDETKPMTPSSSVLTTTTKKIVNTADDEGLSQKSQFLVQVQTKIDDDDDINNNNSNINKSVEDQHDRYFRSYLDEQKRSAATPGLNHHRHYSYSTIAGFTPATTGPLKKRIKERMSLSPFTPSEFYDLTLTPLGFCDLTPAPIRDAAAANTATAATSKAFASDIKVQPLRLPFADILSSNTKSDSRFSNKQSPALKSAMKALASSASKTSPLSAPVETQEKAGTTKNGTSFTLFSDIKTGSPASSGNGHPPPMYRTKSRFPAVLPVRSPVSSHITRNVPHRTALAKEAVRSLDATNPSSYICLIRNQFEFFEASPDDVALCRSKNVPAFVGQVGMRCKHCLCVPVAIRPKGSLVFARKLDALYKYFNNSENNSHLDTCPFVPEAERKKIDQFTQNFLNSLASFHWDGLGYEYWLRSTKDIIQTKEGLRFKAKSSPTELTSNFPPHVTTKPNPPPQLNTDIFSKGAYVRVDPSSTSRGGVGFVTSVHAKERRVDVKYDENSVGVINSSPFIDERRLNAHLLSDAVGRTNRSGRRCVIDIGESASTAPFRSRKRKQQQQQRSNGTGTMGALLDSKKWASNSNHPQKANGGQPVGASDPLLSPLKEQASDHSQPRLEQNDAKAVFESLRGSRPFPSHLTIQVVATEGNNIISPPFVEFPEGIYVLTRKSKLPPHLAHLQVKQIQTRKVCKWQVSGPQFPKTQSTSTQISVQQRYAYPRDNTEYSNRTGGTVWTLLGNDGKEEFEYRLFQVYCSQKRVSNQSSNNKHHNNKNLQQEHSKAIDYNELLEKLKPQEKVSRIIADKASLTPTPTPPNSPEGAWA